MPALSRRADVAGAAALNSTGADCVRALVVSLGHALVGDLSTRSRKLDNPRAQLRIADPRHTGCFRQQTRFRHSGNGVDLEDSGLAVLRQKDVDTRIDLQA